MREESNDMRLRTITPVLRLSHGRSVVDQWILHATDFAH